MNTTVLRRSSSCMNSSNSGSPRKRSATLPHEHESVTLQCVERISSLSNGVTDRWKRNTRGKPEAIGIFAYDACGILVTSTRQLSDQSGVTEINPRRSNRSNRGLDIVAIHHFERSAE